MDDIYGEILPDRINFNDEVDKQYPPQLIITFENLKTPNLGSVSVLIRKHIMECIKQKLNPDIVLNFCIDHVIPIEIDEHVPKFMFLCEYIHDIKKQMPDLTISISVRGYFLKCMIPLLYLGIPVRMTPNSLVQQYQESEGLSLTGGVTVGLKSPIETFITSFLGKQIARPFKMDKNIILDQKLITQ